MIQRTLNLAKQDPYKDNTIEAFTFPLEQQVQTRYLDDITNISCTEKKIARLLYQTNAAIQIRFPNNDKFRNSTHICGQKTRQNSKKLTS